MSLNSFKNYLVYVNSVITLLKIYSSISGVVTNFVSAYQQRY